MGALLGLGVGVGLLLIWSAFTMPRSTTTPNRGGAAKLRARLAGAGLASVSARSVIFTSLALGLLTGVVIQLVTATWPVAFSFAAMAAWAPFLTISARARRRQLELAEVWPDAVDNLASAVRAGMSLPDALGALATSGPEPLHAPFAQFARDYQLTGKFSDSLDRLKEDLADPVGDRVVEGLRIAREVGGGELGRLLRNLSSFLREDQHTRSEMMSRQAWVVNGARLAVAAPWVVLLFMAVQGGAIQRYSSPSGVLVLACGAVACVGAYRAMMRIGRLPTERRILA